METGNEKKKINAPLKGAQRRAHAAEADRGGIGPEGNAPLLRFPQFEGEWEENEVGNVMELRNGYTPSKEVLSFWQGGTIPWFRMEDIRENGGVLSDSIQHITKEAVKSSGLFPRNSIILATTATIGVHAMIIADSLANQRFTNFSIRKSHQKEFDPYFVYYYFFKIDEWCLRNTNAGGLLSVDIAGLKKYRFSFPTLPEQRKIADFLSLLDERIAAQRALIGEMERLKSAMIENIFCSISKEWSVSKTPRLRFRGFEGDWEYCEVGDVMELRNGYTPSKEVYDYWQGGTIPWFRMEDIRENGGVLSDSIQHITKEAVKNSGLFPKYSIILATTATIGVHAMIIADSLANQRFTNFSIRKSLKKNFDPYFVYYYFFKIDEWCLSNTNAGGLLSVDIAGLKRHKISFPSLPEQRKIADCLSLLDERIATYKDILSAYQKQKTYLLQKMFI